MTKHLICCWKSARLHNPRVAFIISLAISCCFKHVIFKKLFFFLGKLKIAFLLNIWKGFFSPACVSLLLLPDWSDSLLLFSYMSTFREPVSHFKDDSIYAVSLPQVDRGSHEMFASHVMTGHGQVRALCREDILMYREYVKNRYMWKPNIWNWMMMTKMFQFFFFARDSGKLYAFLLTMYRRPYTAEFWLKKIIKSNKPFVYFLFYKFSTILFVQTCLLQGYDGGFYI